jgi:molybdopterin-guanine dinucleotide biosynthesis protein A
MGQPKALLEIDGETFLSRSVQIVSSVCNRVIVVAGPNQELPVLPDQVEICRDLVEHGGPARALISALENCVINSDHVFVTGCDYPFISAGLIQWMARLAARDAAVLAFVGGVFQPMPAIYPVKATCGLSEIQSMKKLLAQLPATKITESELRQVDHDLAAFKPINTPEDYEWAVRYAASGAIRKPD